MEDNTSMASFTSHQTIPDDSSLPSYSQAMSRKKKIIPVVQSEPESSPSPEHPSSPISSPKPRDSSAGSTLGSLSSRFRQSQAIEQSDLGNKLKNSFSKILSIFWLLFLILFCRIQRQGRQGREGAAGLRTAHNLEHKPGTSKWDSSGPRQRDKPHPLLTKPADPSGDPGQVPRQDQGGPHRTCGGASGQRGDAGEKAEGLGGLLGRLAHQSDGDGSNPPSKGSYDYQAHPPVGLILNSPLEIYCILAFIYAPFLKMLFSCLIRNRQWLGLETREPINCQWVD